MFIIRSRSESGTLSQGETVLAVVPTVGSLFFFCNMLTDAGAEYKVIGEEGGPRRPTDFGWGDMHGWLDPADKFRS